MLVDPNVTFSPEVCNLAIGGVAGAFTLFAAFTKVLSFLVIIYVVKKLSEIIIAAINRRRK